MALLREMFGPSAEKVQFFLHLEFLKLERNPEFFGSGLGFCTSHCGIAVHHFRLPLSRHESVSESTGLGFCDCCEHWSPGSRIF
jgi:hypothetical protein